MNREVWCDESYTANEQGGQEGATANTQEPLVNTQEPPNENRSAGLDLQGNRVVQVGKGEAGGGQPSSFEQQSTHEPGFETQNSTQLVKMRNYKAICERASWLT